MGGSGIATDDDFHKQVKQTFVRSSLGRVESDLGQRDWLGETESPSIQFSMSTLYHITRGKSVDASL